MEVSKLSLEFLSEPSPDLRAVASFKEDRKCREKPGGFSCIANMEKGSDIVMVGVVVNG
jgi:hypothetical protein